MIKDFSQKTLERISEENHITYEQAKTYGKIFANAFEDSVNLSELKFIKSNSRYDFFQCLCQVAGHYALRKHPFYWKAGKQWIYPTVLNCYENNKQWLIINDIEQMIKDEEEKFTKLLNKFEKNGLIYKKYDAQEAFKMWQEKGLPVEMMEISNIDRFNQLVSEHKEKSKNDRFKL